jgi:hypothetical protein
MCLTDALSCEGVLSMNVNSQGPARHHSPKFCTVAIVFLGSHQVVEDPNPRGTDVGESTRNTWKRQKPTMDKRA